mgnify:CR=1 FL=1
MHTFQKKDKTVLTMNPFDKIGKQWMLITSGDEDKANTMTASWGGVGVLWGSDVVYIFVRQSRYTKEFIDKTGHFSISFLGEEYRKAEMGIRSAKPVFLLLMRMGYHILMKRNWCLPVQHFLQQILLWIRCWMQKLSQNGMRMAIFIRCMLGRLKRY